ncbi:hypothetical protein EG328_003802 [Venturia inaequalis]|uniref:PLC-like phosphodiesterase n=1 Tax=Venturia inaequalis TaxID=5025 RepID=A0A8H3YYM3_VENIN|nr:hypothetical protein EG328_003802 [Venturia inaequalis]RDI86741.1 hypothetical protein Vi05172_g3173 [Venturia inaequalis]
MFSLIQSAALGSLLWQSATAQPQTSTSTACNNSPALCSRGYGNITHLGAHDSPFVSNSSNRFTSSGNQFFNSTMQLDAGVRLLSAQIHNVSSTDSSLHLCHSNCALYDAGPLTTWLASISTWLDANPNEVVTLLLVNSVNADASTLAAQFSTSGIKKFAYTPTTVPTSAAGWPTLQTLITANTRLITFVASLPSGNAAAPYLLDEFTSIWENPYDNISPSNFTCTPDRPATVKGSLTTAKTSGKLFLMNHFLYVSQLFGIESPNVDASTTTNSPDATLVGSLGSAASTCQTQYGSAPNFILVDWFNVGPTISTVDSLNGVTSSISGRKSVSAMIMSQTFQGAGVGADRGRSAFALVVGFGVAVLAGWN